MIMLFKMKLIIMEIKMIIIFQIIIYIEGMKTKKMKLEF